MIEDDRLGIEGFLAVVSEDVGRATAQRAEMIHGAPPDRYSSPQGEWSEPMSWAEVARRVFGNPKDRARKVKLLFKSDEFQQVSPKLVRVRLDKLDSLTRRRIEKARIFSRAGSVRSEV